MHFAPDKQAKTWKIKHFIIVWIGLVDVAVRRLLV
jgi:hypothetical protein